MTAVALATLSDSVAPIMGIEICLRARSSAALLMPCFAADNEASYDQSLVALLRPVRHITLNPGKEGILAN